jgi:hypothetical protein
MTFSVWALMLFLYFRQMIVWLGCLGVFLAIIFFPGAATFPFIVWIVEGDFPITYFALWGLGILASVIMGLLSEN